MAIEINGDGLITVDGSGNTQGRVRLKEDTDNGSNYIELTAPASVTSDRTITFPDGTGTVAVNGVSSNIVLETAKASTSGTNIDFTGIPSWVKRITVSTQGVSTSGTSLAIFQILTSSGAETTGYVGYAIQQITNSSGLRSYTAGFGFGNGTTTAATSTRNGVGVFTLLTGNTWAFQGQWADTTGSSVIVQSAGTKSLSNSLTGIRITTENGTDTFDAGTINIMYE